MDPDGDIRGQVGGDDEPQGNLPHLPVDPSSINYIQFPSIHELDQHRTRERLQQEQREEALAAAAATAESVDMDMDGSAQPGTAAETAAATDADGMEVDNTQPGTLETAAAATDAVGMDVDDSMGLDNTLGYCCFGPFQEEYEKELRALGSPPNDDEGEGDDDGYYWAFKKFDLDTKYSQKLLRLLEQQSDGDETDKEAETDKEDDFADMDTMETGNAMDTGNEEGDDEMDSFKTKVDGCLLKKNPVSQ